MRRIVLLLAVIGVVALVAGALRRDDVKAGARKAGDTVSKTAHQAKEKVEEKVGPLADKAASTIRHSADEAADELAADAEVLENAARTN